MLICVDITTSRLYSLLSCCARLCRKSNISFAKHTVLIVTTALVAVGSVASLASTRVILGNKDKGKEMVELGLVNDSKVEVGEGSKTPGR
jgi:hypothetical protein